MFIKHVSILTKPNILISLVAKIRIRMLLNHCCIFGADASTRMWEKAQQLVK